MDRAKPSVFVAVRPPGSQQSVRLDVSNVVETFEYVDSESKADTLKLTIKNDDLEAFDNPIWKKGNLLTVQWGYPGAMAQARECVIEKVTGFAKLAIEAHALSMLMNKAAKCRTWENVTRSEVAAKIAGEWGYGADMQHIEATTQRFEVLSQGRVSDAAFLKRLANKQGFVFFLDFDGLHFHSRQMQQPTHRVLTYFTDPGRGDVKEIQIENDITAKPAAVQVVGRDEKAKEDLIAQVRSNYTGGGPVGMIASAWEVFNAPPDIVGDELADWGARYAERVRAQQAAPTALAPVAEITTPAEDDREGFRRFLRAQNAYFHTAMIEVENAGAPSADAVADRFTEILEGVWFSAPTEAVASTGIVPTADGAEAAGTEAQATAARIQQTTVKMTMKIVGDPTLLAKTVVEVCGIGRRLSGPYYVTEVKHTIGSGYTCELKMRSDGTRGYQHPDFPEPAREQSRQDPPTVWTSSTGLHEEQRETSEGESYTVWLDAQGREAQPNSAAVTAAREEMGYV